MVSAEAHGANCPVGLWGCMLLEKSLLKMLLMPATAAPFLVSFTFLEALLRSPVHPNPSRVSPGESPRSCFARSDDDGVTALFSFLKAPSWVISGLGFGVVLVCFFSRAHVRQLRWASGSWPETVAMYGFLSEVRLPGRSLSPRQLVHRSKRARG